MAVFVFSKNLQEETFHSLKHICYCVITHYNVQERRNTLEISHQISFTGFLSGKIFNQNYITWTFYVKGGLKLLAEQWISYIFIYIIYLHIYNIYIYIYIYNISLYIYIYIYIYIYLSIKIIEYIYLYIQGQKGKQQNNIKQTNTTTVKTKHHQNTIKTPLQSVT